MAEPREMSGVEADRLADMIDAHRPEILSAYEDALRDAGSAIVNDSASLRQAQANSEQVLDDVTASLRAGKLQVDERYKLMAMDIGVSRAAGGFHPKDSLYASSLFFAAVLAKLLKFVGSSPDGLDLLAFASTALERSLSLRIIQASASFSGFLLNKVQEAQVDERRRIARELHDRIGHGISVTHRQLELCDLYRATDPAKACVKFRTAQRAVQETMNTLRAVTSELHTQGHLRSLEVALLNYLNTAEVEDVTVRLRVDGDEQWASPAILDEAFLIVREAAHNALRHAAPSILLLNVDITPDMLRASIEDDGCGFDPQLPAVSGGIGLSSMRERAQLLGGTVKVASSAGGGGTQVDVSIPLKGEIVDDTA
jgi:signal transduction histidine kinase